MLTTTLLMLRKAMTVGIWDCMGICHDQYKDMPYDIPLYVAYESYATYNMPLCIAIYTPYRVHITRWHVSHALGSCQSLELQASASACHWWNDRPQSGGLWMISCFISSPPSCSRCILTVPPFLFLRPCVSSSSASLPLFSFSYFMPPSLDI